MLYPRLGEASLSLHNQQRRIKVHMKTFDNPTDQPSPSLIGRYNVADARGEKLGTLDALGTDEQTGKVEFLGVKTLQQSVVKSALQDL
jgi:hypothetical protein